LLIYVTPFFFSFLPPFSYLIHLFLRLLVLVQDVSMAKTRSGAPFTKTCATPSMV
jgi:hypothetical protein